MPTRAASPSGTHSRRARGACWKGGNGIRGQNAAVRSKAVAAPRGAGGFCCKRGGGKQKKQTGGEKNIKKGFKPPPPKGKRRPAEAELPAEAGLPLEAPGPVWGRGLGPGTQPRSTCARPPRDPAPPVLPPGPSEGAGPTPRLVPEGGRRWGGGGEEAAGRETARGGENWEINPKSLQIKGKGGAALGRVLPRGGGTGRDGTWGGRGLAEVGRQPESGAGRAPSGNTWARPRDPETAPLRRGASQ